MVSDICGRRLNGMLICCIHRVYVLNLELAVPEAYLRSIPLRCVQICTTSRTEPRPVPRRVPRRELYCATAKRRREQELEPHIATTTRSILQFAFLVGRVSRVQ